MVTHDYDRKLDKSIARTENRKMPPLENGDRLSRLEFERRYAAMPEYQKAELIEGVVYLKSLLRFESHKESGFRWIVVGCIGITLWKHDSGNGRIAARI